MYKNKLLHTLPEKSEIYSYKCIYISTFPSTFHMLCAYTELFINTIEAIVNLYFLSVTNVPLFPYYFLMSVNYLFFLAEK